MSYWSKLQKELYNIIDDRLDFQIHCVSYRMNGKTSIPRYFITLNKEIVFDYPKQFLQTIDFKDYPYQNDVSAISDLIRDYIDTPIAQIADKKFEFDKWQLTDILKSADRRIGQRRLDNLLSQTENETARQIIKIRKSL